MTLSTKYFKPYKSSIYNIKVSISDKAFEFDNELGEGHYNVSIGDIILKGTLGERWVIPKIKLAKYEFLDGSEIDYDTCPRGVWLDIRTRESSAITWAVQVTEPNLNITTPEGQHLIANADGYDHGDGDYICCADNNGQPTFEWGCWCVNGRVFPNTYKSKHNKK